MFRKAYELWKKHREKAIVIGAVSGGVYLYQTNDAARQYIDDAFRWVWGKLPLESGYLSSNSSESRRGNPSSSDAQRSQSANSFRTTVRILLHKASDALNKQLNIDHLRQLLDSSPDQKLQIWDQIKIVSWARCFASVYLLSQIIVFVQVEIAVTGAYLAGKSEEELRTSLSIVAEHLRLMAEYPVTEGLEELVNAVTSAVSKPLASIPIQQSFSASHVEELICDVRGIVERKSIRSVDGPLYPYYSPYVVSRELLEGIPDERTPLSHAARCISSLSDRVLTGVTSTYANMIVSCCLDLAFAAVQKELTDLMNERRSPSETLVIGPSLPHVTLLPAAARFPHLLLESEDSSAFKELVELPYLTTFGEQLTQGMVRH